MAEDELDVLIAAHYRWWTWSASRDHLKLGPLAFAWYRWVDGCWHLDAMWLCRDVVFRLPRLE